MKIKITQILDVLMVAMLVTIYCFDGIGSLLKYESIAIVLFCVSCSLYLLHKRYISGIFLKLFLPFCAFCFASYLWSLRPQMTISRSFTVLQIGVVCAILFEYVYRENKTDLFIKSLIAGGILFGVYIIHYYGGIASFILLMNEADRIGAEVTHLSRIGQSIALSAVLCMQMIFQSKRKIWYYLILTVDVLVILACQSRTGLIVLIAGLFVVLFHNLESKRRKSTLISLGLILAALIAFVELFDFTSVSEGLGGIINTFIGKGGDLSSQRRLEMIEKGLKSFTEHPILGTGLASSGEIAVTISGNESYLHNSYVEMLATTGIIGFVLYFAMYVRPLWKLRQCEKSNNVKIAIEILLSEAVMFMGTVGYFVKFHYLYLVLFMCLAELEYDKIKRKENA